MKRVLIVDDESIVRVALRSLIDWEKHGYMVVRDCMGGRQAVDNGVFHNGLQDQPGHLIIQASPVNMVLHLKSVGIADFHQINIAVQHIQFLPYRIETNAAPE